MAQRTARRLLPRVAAGAAPLAWLINDQHTRCEQASLPRQTTLAKLKSMWTVAPSNEAVGEATGKPSKFDKLKNLYSEKFVKMLDGAVLQQFNIGQYIFRTNDVCNDSDSLFYCILDGAVEVVKDSVLEGEGQVGSQLSSGAFFGDLAFLAKESRRVRNILATTDSIILGISKADFETALLDINPRIGTPNGDTRDARVMAFAELVSPSTTMTLQKDETVFRQGDTCDDAALYIVKSGSLKMLKKEGNGNEIEVKEVEEGECVGYVSLFLKDTSAGKSYTVAAGTPSTELAVIKKADFLSLMDRSQMFADYMQTLNREFYMLYAQSKAQEAQVDSGF